mgnify:CR=1 FL=1
MPWRQDTLAAAWTLRGRLADTTHPKLRQDLEILIDAAERQLATRELNRRYFMPYIDPASMLFGVTRSMLDPRTPAELRPYLEQLTSADPAIVLVRCGVNTVRASAAPRLGRSCPIRVVISLSLRIWQRRPERNLKGLPK